MVGGLKTKISAEWVSPLSRSHRVRSHVRTRSATTAPTGNRIFEAGKKGTTIKASPHMTAVSQRATAKTTAARIEEYSASEARLAESANDVTWGIQLVFRLVVRSSSGNGVGEGTGSGMITQRDTCFDRQINQPREREGLEVLCLNSQAIFFATFPPSRSSMPVPHPPSIPWHSRPCMSVRTQNK